MSHKEWEGRRARKRVRTWVRSELAVKKPRDEKDDKDKQDEEDDHEEVASKNRKDNPKTTDEGSTPVDDFNRHGISTLSVAQLEKVHELVLNTSNSYQKTEYHKRGKQKGKAKPPKLVTLPQFKKVESDKQYFWIQDFKLHYKHIQEFRTKNEVADQTLVDAYAQVIRAQCARINPKREERVFIVHSSWYIDMCEDEFPEISCSRTPEDRIVAIFGKQNPFKDANGSFPYDVVIIPIIFDSHFSTVAVDFLSHSVIHYNSLRSVHVHVLETVYEFIKDARDYFQTDLTKWTMSHATIPKQGTNDCHVSTMKAIQIIVFQLPMNVLSIVVQQAKVFRIQMSEELMKIGTKEWLGINQRVVIPSGLYPLYDRYSQNAQERKSVRTVPDWTQYDPDRIRVSNSDSNWEIMTTTCATQENPSTTITTTTTTKTTTTTTITEEDVEQQMKMPKKQPMITFVPLKTVLLMIVVFATKLVDTVHTREHITDKHTTYHKKH